MIKTITLKNVASYKDPGPIKEIVEGINLFYGLNGSGKTILSNYLRHEANKRDKNKNPSDEYQSDINSNVNYDNCSIEGFEDGEKILVYNQEFIRDNFYNLDSQPGIFTLSAENRKAEEKIKKARHEKGELEHSLKDMETKEADQETKGEKYEEEAQNRIWEIKLDYAKTKDLAGLNRPLDFCLEGLRGSKDKLFNHIIEIPKPETKPEKTIETLKDEAQALKDSQPIRELNKISPKNLDAIEKDPIFQEPIIGNENSPVKELIKHFDNDDWVHKGIEYISDPEDITENEQCPFCQGKTISKDLAKEIKNYFDDAYTEQLERVKQLKDQYARNKANRAKEKFDKNTYIQKDTNKREHFNGLYADFLSKLDANLREIENKINAPSQKVELQSTQDNLEQLNQAIDRINEGISEHNRQIQNMQKTKKNLNDIFWKIMRWDYDQTIARYQEDRKNIQNKIRETEGNIKELRDKIKEQDEIIEKEQKNTINIQTTIDNINNGLSGLGLEGFRIEQYEQESYKIVRDEQNKNNFKTLSEGEKMIISFLYFIELCLGKEQPDEIDKKKIIVIDDPISSLSHTHIFNVAMLIKEKLLGDDTQLFVLTHSLYFFHELIKIKKDYKIEYFRITKGEQGSAIERMEKDEIQNEYQSYWQIIKDPSEKVRNVLLANIMRNILEHFFTFISKGSLKNELQGLDKNKYNAFIRYMDRESHSDATNIYDSKEIDCDLFKKAFKQVFIDAGYEAHYEKYMGEES